MNADLPPSRRSRAPIARLLVVLLLWPAASTGWSAIAPLTAASGAPVATAIAVDDVTESAPSAPATSTRRARSIALWRRFIDRHRRQHPVRVRATETRRATRSPHAPPMWRGPQVLLI